MIAARGLLAAGHGGSGCGTGLRFSSSVAGGLYEVLGVGKSASTEEIKSAFRKKAKAHHPDVSFAAASEFGVILHAYQVLSDPAQRELYNLQHDAGTAGFLRRAASHKREHDEMAEERAEWGWDWMSDPQCMRPAKQGSNIARLRAELQAEFRDALLHAYHGPRVDMTARRLPAAFEADERTDFASPDILQLLSGRQLLGVVRERQMQALGAGAAAKALRHQPDPRQIGGQAPADAAAEPGSGAGAARPAAGAAQAADARHAAGVAGCASAPPAARDRPQRRVLDLVLGDGDVAAFGVQQVAGAACSIEIFLGDGSLVYSEGEGGQVVKPSGSSGSGSGKQQRRQTHRAVLSHTPFVRHLDFVALAGVGGLKKDRVICRAKRAWLPPSATWLFKPRNGTHTSGGWYFEWAGWEQHSAHPAWLHPNALVLRAAFETLAAERAEAAGAAAGGGVTGEVAPHLQQPAGLWARLRSRLAGC